MHAVVFTYILHNVCGDGVKLLFLDNKVQHYYFAETMVNEALQSQTELEKHCCLSGIFWYIKPILNV